MTKPTLDELKAIIKEEGLKIQVRADADVDEVIAKIEAKRGKVATDKGGKPSEDEKPVETIKEDKDGKPACLGKFVKTGAPKCRRCWFAQTCKEM